MDQFLVEASRQVGIGRSFDRLKMYVMPFGRRERCGEFCFPLGKFGTIERRERIWFLEKD